MTTAHKATSRAANPVDLANALRPTIARLARRLRQQDNTGLGPTVTAALSTIAKHGGPTHGELAATERLAPPTITSIVDKLERMGFVRREVDPSDRRVTRIRATAAGIDQLEEIRSRRTSWLADQLAELPAEERHRLADAAVLLSKLVDHADGTA